jgi:hypothetical protein
MGESRNAYEIFVGRPEGEETTWEIKTYMEVQY